MDRNELKIELLEYLSDNGGEITSGEVSQLFGITPIDASVQLLRYHRQGLLHRRKRRLHPFGGREYCYSLSDRGMERLNWLISSEEISIRLAKEDDEDEINVELEYD
jgi:DNA-binding transcriptional regulator PaaX